MNLRIFDLLLEFGFIYFIVIEFFLMIVIRIFLGGDGVFIKIK